MVKIINSNKTVQELPIATNRECCDRRNLLVTFGIIKPNNKPDIIFKKDAIPTISTRKTCGNQRKNLIKCGIIQPIEELDDGSITFCELPPKGNRGTINKDEGEYKPQPIKTDEEYYRRRQVYFRMIQEIIYSRKKNKLILGKKKDNDPDWYF